PLGELFRVNFAALPGAGEDRYLIEDGLRVHTLSHEGDLLPAAATAKANRVLLAGAPQFGTQRDGVAQGPTSTARQLCARVAEQGFDALPGAEHELDGLRGVLRSAFGSGTEVDVIDGAQATKERVLAALDGANVVHLATHGFSFDESCGGAEG